MNWAEPDPAQPYLLFLRVSARHYARLYLSPERLQELLADDAAILPRAADGCFELRYRVEDFLDDDDRDGDPLDPCELHAAGDGIQALLVERGI